MAMDRSDDVYRCDRELEEELFSTMIVYLTIWASMSGVLFVIRLCWTFALPTKLHPNSLLALLGSWPLIGETVSTIRTAVGPISEEAVLHFPLRYMAARS